MKIRVLIDPDRDEEVLIYAHSASPQLRRLQEAIEKALSHQDAIAVKKGASEVFLDCFEILFAETSGDRLWVHTATDVYQCPLRLYELEERLPRGFARASKSCLVNASLIFALFRSPSGVGEARFSGSEKRVFISRRYYKGIRDKIAEMRLEA